MATARAEATRLAEERDDDARQRDEQRGRADRGEADRDGTRAAGDEARTRLAELRPKLDAASQRAAAEARA